MRYAGDYNTMQKYLEDKLVVGTDRPVGVAQLLTAIENLTTGPKERIPAALHRVTKFIPLIVTRDDIASSWVTNNYLNRRFQEKLKPECNASHEITSVVSISVSSLERLMHVMSNHAFSDILEKRIAENPELNAPFESACKHIPAGATHGMWKHVQVMKGLADRIAKDFGMTE